MWLDVGLTRQVLTSQLTLIGPLAGSLGPKEGLDSKGRAGLPGLLKTPLRQTRRSSLLVTNGILIGTRVELFTFAFLLERVSVLLDPRYFHCGWLACAHAQARVCELRDCGGA